MPNAAGPFCHADEIGRQSRWAARPYAPRGTSSALHATVFVAGRSALAWVGVAAKSGTAVMVCAAKMIHIVAARDAPQPLLFGLKRTMRAATCSSFVTHVERPRVEVSC